MDGFILHTYIYIYLHIYTYIYVKYIYIYICIYVVHVGLKDLPKLLWSQGWSCSFDALGRCEVPCPIAKNVPHNITRRSLGVTGSGVYGWITDQLPPSQQIQVKLLDVMETQLILTNWDMKCQGCSRAYCLKNLKVSLLLVASQEEKPPTVSLFTSTKLT